MNFIRPNTDITMLYYIIMHYLDIILLYPDYIKTHTQSKTSLSSHYDATSNSKNAMPYLGKYLQIHYNAKSRNVTP